MANRLILRYKTIAAPGNVERTYATKVNGEPATLANYLTKAKTAVHEEAGFLEFELAAETPSPSGGTNISGSSAQKYLANVNDISNVEEY
jgi:hypothetical protein